MNKDLRQAFKDDGFVLLKGVLDAGEIAEIREALPPYYDKLKLTPKRYLQARECLEVEPVYCLMAHPKITQACRDILGDQLVYVNDLVVQRNVIPARRTSPHLDCQAEFRFNQSTRYLLDPDFIFAKIGVYLQKNTEAFGGGIDISPGAHKWVANRVFFSYRFYQKVMRPRFARNMTLLETEPGDVLIFDSRLPHRSTFGTQLNHENYKESDDGTTSIPEERAKYVVYWEVTRKGDEVHFVECNKNRAVKDERNRPLGAYRPRCSYLGLVYPDDYPPDLVRKLEAEKVDVFTVKREEAETWLAAFKEGAGDAAEEDDDGR
ncbi:MAG: phytanoyl-CoA dioxygenase family protein [Kiloniellaceae bacterium]